MVNRYKSIIESLLFVWGEPISLYRIASVLDISESECKKIIEMMKLEYIERGSGIQIVETNKHYQFSTLKENYPYLEKITATSKNKGLSASAIETLAIIAYRQPITKIEIEEIRGVSADNGLRILMSRNLVEVKGTLERIGRPRIYGTTEEFLRSFGFTTINELPAMEEFTNHKLFAQETDETNDEGDE